VPPSASAPVREKLSRDRDPVFGTSGSAAAARLRPRRRRRL